MASVGALRAPAQGNLCVNDCIQVRIYPLIALAVMLLQGCGIPQSPADFDKPPEAQFLKAMRTPVVENDHPAIESAMDPRVQQALIRQTTGGLP